MAEHSEELTTDELMIFNVFYSKKMWRRLYLPRSAKTCNRLIQDNAAVNFQQILRRTSYSCRYHTKWLSFLRSFLNYFSYSSSLFELKIIYFVFVIYLSMNVLHCRNEYISLNVWIYFIINEYVSLSLWICFILSMKMFH